MITEMFLGLLAEQLAKQSVEAIRSHVEEFIKSLDLDPIGDQDVDADTGGLPSVGVVGIGRCGTNIALDVASSIFAGSACSTYDVYYNIENYIFRCFRKDDVASAEFEEELYKCLDRDEFDSTKIESMLEETEKIAPIVVGHGEGNWNLKRQENEQRFARLSRREDGSPTVAIEDLMLGKKDVVNALMYMHRLEHREKEEVREPSRYAGKPRQKNGTTV